MNPIDATPSSTKGLSDMEPTASRILARFRETNPVFWKDLTITLRTPMYLGSVALAVAALGVLALGVGIAESGNRDNYVSTGRLLFELVLGGAALVMALVGSNLGASAIAQEREARTLDPLTLSALGPRRIVVGKFGAAFMATALVTIATLPILVPIVSFGDIPISALLVAMAGQLVFAAIVVAAGIALSAHAESTRRISLLIVVLALVGTFATGGVLAAIGDTFLVGGRHLLIRGPYFFSEAYFVTPLSAKYVFNLALLPAYVISSLLSLCYLAARAGLMAPSEDRTFAIKGWTIASVSTGGALAALAARALRFGGSETRAMAASWAIGTALLALGLLFVFVAEPVAPSRFAVSHSRGGLQRLLRPGLAPSIVFVLIGTAVALPTGVAAIVGFDADLIERTFWGVAYVGAIGGFVGWIATRDSRSRPTTARVTGVTALALSAIGFPLIASSLESSGEPPTLINALSPGWIAFHDHATPATSLMAGGMILLVASAALFVVCMCRAASKKRELLAQRPAV